MRRKLVREDWGGEIYEYVPLGQYVVMAPGICGGRPTFKYTRIDVTHVLERLAAGRTIDQIVTSYTARGVRWNSFRCVTSALSAPRR